MSCSNKNEKLCNFNPETNKHCKTFTGPPKMQAPLISSYVLAHSSPRMSLKMIFYPFPKKRMAHVVFPLTS